MARTKEEIKVLAASLRAFSKEDFGAEFSFYEWIDSLKGMLRARQDLFLLKRIGHLPNADLTAIIMELRAGAVENAQQEEVAVLQDAAPVNAVDSETKKRGRPYAKK
jgi:hypothetical protein